MPPTKKVPIPANGVDYRGKVVLAPMVRSGELPSRLLALRYGADLVWGPETVDRSMIGTTRRFNPITSTIDFTRLSSNHARTLQQDAKESVIYRLHPVKEKDKLIFQIGTSSPETAVQAAKLVAEDVAGIDVNAGCPKPFSTTGGMGAALLRTPERLASILEALVQEVGAVYQIGISVKIRLLETPEETAALVTKLCQTGITGLTVHCRTTPMRPRERAIRDQLRMIGDICREFGVACLMNGDVKNREEALKLAEEYGVDGGMIATAAEANPSVFQPENEGGLEKWRELVAQYIQFALEVDNRWGNSKFTLTQLMPGKTEEGQRCQRAQNYQQVVQILQLPELDDLAREVDERMGLTDRLSKKEQKAIQNATAKAAGAAMASVKSRKSEKQRSEGARNPLSQRGVPGVVALAI